MLFFVRFGCGFSGFGLLGFSGFDWNFIGICRLAFTGFGCLVLIKFGWLAFSGFCLFLHWD